MKFENIAHLDSPDLTYRDVHIPAFVPLLKDFDHRTEIGFAKLEWHPGQTVALDDGTRVAIPGYLKAYCDAWETVKLEENPIIAAALTDSRRDFDTTDGVAYVEGGSVSAISVLTSQTQKEVFGSDISEERRRLLGST